MSGKAKVDDRLLNLLVPVVIAGVAFAAFYVTSPGGFLSDDYVILYNAMTTTSSNFIDNIILPDASWGFYRPIGMLYWLICYKLFGTDAFGYWSLAVVVHAINGYLVFIILNKLKLGYQGALAGALVFTAIPLHGESVAWLSCAYERLCLLFLLAGTYTYIRYREKQTQGILRHGARIIRACDIIKRDGDNIPGAHVYGRHSNV